MSFCLASFISCPTQINSSCCVSPGPLLILSCVQRPDAGAAATLPKTPRDLVRTSAIDQTPVSIITAWEVENTQNALLKCVTHPKCLYLWGYLLKKQITWWGWRQKCCQQIDLNGMVLIMAVQCVWHGSVSHNPLLCVNWIRLLGLYC